MPRVLVPNRGPVMVPQSGVPYPRPPYAQNPVYQRPPPVSPIHLSGFVALQPGGSDAPPRAAFQNPMGEDMEILEIKFEAQAATGAFSPQNPGVLGGMVLCELNMGAVRLTNGAVPIWGFGRAENISAEQEFGEGSAIAYNQYVWRLPRPLFVPAGAVVEPKFVHTGFLNAPIGVRVGFSARTTTVKPKTIFVPWVASYVSKVFNPIETATTDQSTELQLVNDSSGLTGRAAVFHLQRFTGRTLWRNTAQSIFGEGGSASALANQLGLPEFTSQYLTLRMVDSYGRPIVRTYTPFASVFGDITRSWELENVGAKLDPGAFYRVFLKNAGLVPANEGLIQAQAFVSMVGWREVPS